MLKQSTQKQVKSGRRIEFSICLSYFNNKPGEMSSKLAWITSSKRLSGTAFWGKRSFRSSFHILNTFRAHSVERAVLAWIWPLNSWKRWSSLAKLKCSEGTGRTADDDVDGQSLTLAVCGCGAIVTPAPCPGQSVHSHIPRQKGEYEQTCCSHSSLIKDTTKTLGTAMDNCKYN